MNRRTFLSRTALASAGFAGGCATGPADLGTVMTVTGPIPSNRLGMTLVHEHVVVDFIGAAGASPDRYDAEAAFATALPHLQRLRARGVSTLVECTPRHIGRNPALLQRLSKASGLQIITNTGWYAAVDHKFLPPEAHHESADQIAHRWLTEWRRGIGDSADGMVPIRPGFLKLGTGNGTLPPVDAKLVRAAAQVHRKTGLTIAIHTGDGAAAMDEVRLLRDEGVAPGALIWVHAMNDPGPVQIEAAKLGVWISLDGYSLSPPNVLRFPRFLLAHRAAGTLGRVLLSHDDGWAVAEAPGAPAALSPFGNGNRVPYESLFTQLLPDLRKNGFGEDEFRQLLVVNPREALTIRRRPDSG